MCFIKCIVGYSEVDVASCHRIGGLNIFIKCICNVLIRSGFMPQQ